ncbi:MAG: acyltransferase, partial [Alphaproteobacteria bacterium]|nr:acyltransferase [Alphaproteobacteria bacterium]
MVETAGVYSGRDFRPDIQGMRAIAVLLVLIFHVFPNTLPGGYVGVDVFFVISGFLITGILLRSAESQGGVSYLKFYERRARRLLPAASLALVASGVAAFFLLPETRWGNTGWEIIAS